MPLYCYQDHLPEFSRFERRTPQVGPPRPENIEPLTQGCGAGLDDYLYYFRGFLIIVIVECTPKPYSNY